MRPLVSYDDIATPIQETPPNGGPASPPKKRRKTNHRAGQKHGGHRTQSREEDHDDEGEASPKKARKRYGLQEESRQLTHEEVWDDSALVRAWDAAVEEYEVLNGPDKKWKSEPVNKSPLWYNIPPETEDPSTASPGASFLMPSIPASFTAAGHEAQSEAVEPSDPDNSLPVDFDTFVPQHDPSVLNAVKGADGNGASNVTRARGGIVPPPPAGMTSQVTPNEAFQQAMGAWYWAGYWTGVYHSVAKKTVAQLPQGTDAHELETADEVMVDAIEQEEREVSGEQEEQGVSSEQVDENDLIPT